MHSRKYPLREFMVRFYAFLLVLLYIVLDSF